MNLKSGQQPVKSTPDDYEEVTTDIAHFARTRIQEKSRQDCLRQREPPTMKAESAAPAIHTKHLKISGKRSKIKLTEMCGTGLIEVGATERNNPNAAPRLLRRRIESLGETERAGKS